MANNKPRQMYRHDVPTPLHTNGANGPNETMNEGERERAVQDQALLYVGMTEGDTEGMGYWVPVPMGAYKGMSVLFRTNNPTKVRRQKPFYEETSALRAKRVELARLSAMSASASTEVQSAMEMLLKVAPDPARAIAPGMAPSDIDDTLEDRLSALKKEYSADMEKALDEHHDIRCRWLSKFVLSFDPWPFKNIECPDPGEPDSYIVLHEELEDLYNWIMDKGYEAALAASSKNS